MEQADSKYVERPVCPAIHVCRRRNIVLFVFTLITIYLYFGLVDRLRSTWTHAYPDPPLKFSKLHHPFSLALLRSYKSAWSSYDNGTDYQKSNIPCSEIGVPRELLHTTRVRVRMDSLSFEDLRLIHSTVKPGGHWYPESCTAKFRTAIIIPYRNREEHLRNFLDNIHPFLKTQNMDYAVFVIEQTAGAIFNRGMLMNIGFAEARKLYDWQCYVFHDVDLIPEDIRNCYSCPGAPRHLAAAIDKYNYKLSYATAFGGVSILTKKQVIDMNGFSNLFWGWGGEDDDFYQRTRYANLKFVRAPMDIGRYKMIKHKRDKSNPTNPKRHDLLRTGRMKYKIDGVNSLKYDLIRIEPKKLFTWVYVKVNGPSGRHD